MCLPDQGCSQGVAHVTHAQEETFGWKSKLFQTVSQKFGVSVG